MSSIRLIKWMSNSDTSKILTFQKIAENIKIKYQEIFFYNHASFPC